MRCSGSRALICLVASTPSSLGHGDVHQDDVGLDGGGQVDGLGAVSGFADHVEAELVHRAS